MICLPNRKLKNLTANWNSCKHNFVIWLTVRLMEDSHNGQSSEYKHTKCGPVSLKDIGNLFRLTIWTNLFKKNGFETCLIVHTNINQFIIRQWKNLQNYDHYSVKIWYSMTIQSIDCANIFIIAWPWFYYYIVNL